MAVNEAVWMERVANSTYGALHVTTPQGSFVWKQLIVGNQNGWSELAAYRIAQRLGLAHVPYTAVYQVGQHSGTLCAFVPDAVSPYDASRRAALRKELRRFLLSPNFASQAASMLAFDGILGNQDRHAGNWLIDTRGQRLWWIDHGSVKWTNQPKHLPEAFKKLGYTLKSMACSQKDIRQVLGSVQIRLAALPAQQISAWQAISAADWAGIFEWLPEQAQHFAKRQAFEHSWAALATLLRGGGVCLADADLEKVLAKIARWEPKPAEDAPERS